MGQAEGKIWSRSPKDTERLGEAMAEKLHGGEVLALFGPMGMGKTAFVRGLARGLGISEGVSSPTFALVHEYQGRLPVYHFDMFRVTTWDDLVSTGFFDYLETGGVLVIEWSENIEEALPQGVVTIRFSPGEGEQDRMIQWEGMEL